MAEQHTPGAVRAAEDIAMRYGLWENRFDHKRPIPTPQERNNIVAAIIDQETGLPEITAERDRLRAALQRIANFALGVTMNTIGNVEIIHASLAKVEPTNPKPEVSQ